MSVFTPFVSDADPRIHALWHALILFRLLPKGFRRADLRNHLADLSGRHPETLGPGAMTYQLRRLRLHGMIQRLPNTHCYSVTDTGFRGALFFTRAYKASMVAHFRLRSKSAVPSTTEHSRSTFNCGRTTPLPKPSRSARTPEPETGGCESPPNKDPIQNRSLPWMLLGNMGRTRSCSVKDELTITR